MATLYLVSLIKKNVATKLEGGRGKALVAFFAII